MHSGKMPKFLAQAYPAGFLQKLGEELGESVIVRQAGNSYRLGRRFVVPCKVCTTGGKKIGTYKIFTDGETREIVGVSYEDAHIYLSAFVTDKYRGMGKRARVLNFPGFAG